MRNIKLISGITAAAILFSCPTGYYAADGAELSDADYTAEVAESDMETNLESMLGEEQERIGGDIDNAFYDNSDETEPTVTHESEPVVAALAADDGGNFEDVSSMSDEEFFGVWDQDSGEWSTAGKLDYSYSADLAEVERLVKLNSYSLAKTALLEYYKNRNSIERADFGDGINWQQLSINMKDAYSFTENALAFTNITNTGDYEEYTVDLLSYKSTSDFVISSLFKTDDMVQIASRESGLSPSLLIVKKDGSSVTLYPTKDTYIRAYDTEEDYSNEVYGDSEELFVKDAYHQAADGSYKPYSSKTRRTYISFDSDQFPGDRDRMYLKFYAKIVPEEGSSQTTETNHELTVFSAYNTSWDETESESNLFKPMNWANYKIAHYSWNGVPGGFDWQRPDNVPSEWMNYNTRFYNIESMAKASVMLDNDDYMKKSMTDMLHFIEATNGRIEAGVPTGRDIESANRVLNFPGLLAAYLDTDYLNGEALTAMLKWLWQESTYLYNGAGILYNGATDEPTANNYAETNRGLWHSRSFEGVCTYFPEFADRNDWKTVADMRLNTVSHVLLNDDGCYQEPTFGYPVNMISYYIALNKILKDSGDEIPDWYVDRVSKFARYVMYISYPNGVPPKWGEGAAGNTRNTVKQMLDLKDDEELKYYAYNGTDGTEPAVKSEFFERLRLATCRTGWDEDASMMIMSAKNGGNHNHKDSLAILYYSDGRDILADTGMTSYDSGHPHFQWQRHTTRSHNTIEIDGTAQRGSDFLYNMSDSAAKHNGESELNLYPSNVADRITAWTDATLGFRHYRNVSFVKNHDFLIVSDKVSPSDNKEHTYTQNWHTSALAQSHPSIDDSTKQGSTHYVGGTNLIISQAMTDNLTASLETGYSADSSNPTKYFCYKQTAVGDVAYNTVIFPTKEGTSTDMTVASLDTGVDPSVASAMNINIFKDDEDSLNVVYYNSFDARRTTRYFGDYSANASNVMLLQDADGLPSFIAMYGGDSFENDGDTVISSDRVLGDIEVQYDGRTAVITSKDENISAANVIMKAPYKIENATLNGERIPFAYTDGKLYIGDFSSLDMSGGKNYVISIKAVNGEMTYFITTDIPSDSVSSGTLQMPTASFGGKLLTISLGEARLTSSARITVEGHTGKSSYITYGGNSINVGKSSRLGLTLEQANAYVTDTTPIAEHGREDIIIWTKILGTVNVGAAASTESPGGGGGGGNAAPGIKKFTPTGGVTAPDGNKGDESGNGDDKDDTKTTVPFTDINGHWAQDDIAYMYSKGYVNGKTATEFDPDSGITRAEFAAIAMRSLGMTGVSYKGIFDDVTDADWYADTVQTVSDKGIMTGYKGTFRPNDGITREEMAAILVRLCEASVGTVDDASGNFADDAKISDWARNDVYKAVAAGLMNGVSADEFDPLSGATRAQAASVLRRLTDKIGEVTQ